MKSKSRTILQQHPSRPYLHQSGLEIMLKNCFAWKHLPSLSRSLLMDPPNLEHGETQFDKATLPGDHFINSVPQIPPYLPLGEVFSTTWFPYFSTKSQYPLSHQRLITEHGSSQSFLDPESSSEIWERSEFSDPEKCQCIHINNFAQNFGKGSGLLIKRSCLSSSYFPLHLCSDHLTSLPYLLTSLSFFALWNHWNHLPNWAPPCPGLIHCLTPNITERLLMPLEFPELSPLGHLPWSTFSSSPLLHCKLLKGMSNLLSIALIENADSALNLVNVH